MNKPREFWLDICTPYGDPCDFISEGKPHESPGSTNIHVKEVLPNQVTLDRSVVEEMLFMCDDDASGILFSKLKAALATPEGKND